ncbi:MAG: peptidylprolyl isomerase [Tannerellaceae bacterium]|nr:peptidylprolyl isomerase [Tannerellaceae bacterium]
MKKILLLSFVLIGFIVKADINPDSVVMTVAGKPVSLAEFKFIASKNNEIDFSNEESVKNYVELFKNFKLKVAEAEALGLNKNSAFERELRTYRAQLRASYFSDKEAEEAAARKMFDRNKEVLEISQIFFHLHGPVFTKDTLAVYQEAMKVYQRLQQGEDFETVGKELEKKYPHVHHHHSHDHADCDHDHITDGHELHVDFRHTRNFLPYKSLKAFDEAVYSTPVGTYSLPVRTDRGYHIIKVHGSRPNPGFVKTAHILIACPEDVSEEEQTKALKKAQEILQKIRSGEDFAELANEFSDDKSTGEGGVMNYFGVGEMVEPFEVAAFSLTNPGDISEPVKTQFGYHIIQLLGKRDLPTFEQEKEALIKSMGRDEWNFELYSGYDERMKKEYGYVFFPEAYEEIQEIANEYFPATPEFYQRAKELKKPLFLLNGQSFPQSEFADYLMANPLSLKVYCGDFLQDVYNLFLRDLLKIFEEENFDNKYPEYYHLIQEYQDGMLLFEICSREIWNKPVEEQDAYEKEWLQQLSQKYPVVINWDVIKKTGKN